MSEEIGSMKKETEKSPKIRSYWDEQAKSEVVHPRATTPDYWVRELEINHLSEILRELDSQITILDIGCGNGYSTLELLRRFPGNRYVGGDFSPEMIAAALKAAEGLPDDIRGQIAFEELDVLHLTDRYKEQFDLVISDRCLINLPTRELQWLALHEIAGALKSKGHFVAIENFMDGQERLNDLRLEFELDPLEVRWHNLFFEESQFLKQCEQDFELIQLSDISSTYYLVTRVLYSRLCKMEGRAPDYDHPIYSIASRLPPFGNLGPIKLAHMKRIKYSNAKDSSVPRIQGPSS